tara:strand:+ start:516 stop:1955 length:1440 start_codon:yes stop_codon:yes gene_type:complete
MFIINLIAVPEIFISLNSLIILLISVFLKKQSFKFSLYASIIILIFGIFLIILNIDNSYFNYKYLFSSNPFINIFKVLVVVSTILSLLILENYFKDLNIERFEIPILLLFSVLGMMIMISANNLMTMYLGIELQSLSLYVVASVQKNSLKSSEAGLKYFILGALSSAFLLYGCSLIYGFTGSTNFNEINQIIKSLPEMNIGITFGLIFIIVALAFKISAVPFHMWTPDVYEGSPTPITAFFTMAPKIAAIGLLVRLLYEPFGNFWSEWNQIIIFISIASMIIGALAAIVQDNIKRLLAYSSIGHIGYILIGVVSGSEDGIQSIIVYLCIYIAMNIAIFSILLSVKINDTYIENISSISGLSKKNPLISFVLTIMMFSMVGIPPLAGFFGKFYIFMSAINSGYLFLAIIGVLSSVVAAFYYIRIIKVIYFEEPTNEFQIILNYKVKVVIFLSSIFISFFIIYHSIIIKFSDFGTFYFLVK